MRFKNKEAALSYAIKGWKVFPATPNLKTPLAAAAPQGHKNATFDPAIIEQWWTTYPTANIGLHLSASGLVCVDVDNYKENCVFETLTTRAEAVAKDILIAAPVPVRECGSLARGYAGAEARQAGLTGYLAEMAERQGCGFFDAGSAIEVSPLDGVHFGVDAHATLGQALAQAVLDRLR